MSVLIKREEHKLYFKAEKFYQKKHNRQRSPLLDRLNKRFTKKRLVSNKTLSKKVNIMKQTLLLFLLLSSYSIQGQVTSLSEANGTAQLEQANLVQLATMHTSTTGFQGFENPNARIKGTPYLGTNWQDGKIEIAEGYSGTVGIALNIVDQILYVQFDDGSSVELPNTLLRGLLIEQENGEAISLEVHNLYETYGIGPRGYKYYQPLHKGEKYTLWELHTKHMRLEKYIENLGLVRRPNEFRSLYEYWLLDEHGTLHKVKKNDKKLLKAFPEHAKRIKSILKKQEIDIKTAEGLGQLFAALEEID